MWQNGRAICKVPSPVSLKTVIAYMICSRLLVLDWICSSTLIAFLFINNFQRPLPSTGNIYPVPSAGKLVTSAKHGKTVVALTLLWLTTDCYEGVKTFAVLTQCKQTFAITSWYKGRHTVGVTKRGHIIQRQISSYDINYSMQFLSQRHVAWNLVVFFFVRHEAAWDKRNSIFSVAWCTLLLQSVPAET